MKNIIFASLFTTLVFVLTACSTNPIPTNTELPLVEEQEFILSPEVKSGNIQAASLSTTAPRLVVRLSIQLELDDQGNPTGKRYGQAAFFWTDKARSKGGSNLGGIVSVLLRDATDASLLNSFWALKSTPIMSNVDLYTQAGYEDHIAKTAAIAFPGKMCVEVIGIGLISTSDHQFLGSWEDNGNSEIKPVIALCEKTPSSTGRDLRLTSLKGRMFSVPSGTSFPLTMAVINNGSSPAENVSVSYKVPFADQLTFVRDQSALFECSATKQATTNEGLVMNINCHADKIGVGVRSLPLIFSTPQNANIYTVLLEFYMNISTSNPETDTTNNQADSFILLE